MNRAPLLLAAVCFFGVSCERHSWEETKVLHQHGAAHETGGGHEAGAVDHGKEAHPQGTTREAPAKPAEH